MMYTFDGCLIIYNSASNEHKFKKSCIKFLGVRQVLVALMAAKAEVEFDPSKIFPQQIANSITDLGFPSTVIDSAASSGEMEVEVCLLIHSANP